MDSGFSIVFIKSFDAGPNRFGFAQLTGLASSIGVAQTSVQEGRQGLVARLTDNPVNLVLTQQGIDLVFVFGLEEVQNSTVLSQGGDIVTEVCILFGIQELAFGFVGWRQPSL